MQFGYVQGIKRLPLPPQEWKEASNEACKPSPAFPHSLLPFNHNGRKAVQALSKGGKQQRHVVSNVNTAGCGCTSPVARCALPRCLLWRWLFINAPEIDASCMHPEIAKQKSLPSVHSEKLRSALPAYIWEPYRLFCQCNLRPAWAWLAMSINSSF